MDNQNEPHWEVSCCTRLKLRPTRTELNPKNSVNYSGWWQTCRQRNRRWPSLAAGRVVLAAAPDSTPRDLGFHCGFHSGFHRDFRLAQTAPTHLYQQRYIPRGVGFSSSTWWSVTAIVLNKWTSYKLWKRQWCKPFGGQKDSRPSSSPRKLDYHINVGLAEIDQLACLGEECLAPAIELPLQIEVRCAFARSENNLAHG